MPQLLQNFLSNSFSSHLQKLHSMSHGVHDAVCRALHCIALLITPATIWSPIYLNLWMCLVRDSDSGLFIFLIQILIWSYSVALISQLYLPWIQDKETHTHFCPISWLFSIPPVPCTLPACLPILCRFLSYKWHVRHWSNRKQSGY